MKNSIKAVALLMITAVVVILIGEPPSFIASGHSTTTTITFQRGVLPSAAYRGTEDAYISQSRPSTNFGSAAELLVDGNDSVVEDNDLSALLRWDISAIPTGSTVEKVEINLHITNLTGTPYSIYALKRGWSENQVTWEKISSAIRWETGGALGEEDRDTTKIGSAGMDQTGSQTIVLNSDGVAVVQKWVNEPSSNFGLVISDPELEDGLSFDSSEASLPENRPSLSVTFRSSDAPSVFGVPLERLPQKPEVEPLKPDIQPGDGPRQVILMIGDGMGAEVVKAAGMYANGESGSLTMESLSNQGMMTTHSADDQVTDSAASATAMATGTKVNNGVLSMAIPGNGSELPTLLEAYQAAGKRTGLVTSSFITDATPAAFAAHENSRYNSRQIAADYLGKTRPNLLLGGGGNGLTLGAAKNAGYTVVTNRQELQAADLNKIQYLSGQFGENEIPYEYDGVGDLPHLSEMTAAALDMLEEERKGFFLMVEGGNIDHAGHGHELERAIGEVLEFDRSVKIVMDWAASHPDTLVVVTADHETGGLKVLKNNGKGEYPSVDWRGDGHTGIDVPVYAWGVHADLVEGTLDNTDIRQIVFGQSSKSRREEARPLAGLYPGMVLADPLALGSGFQRLQNVMGHLTQ